LVQGAHVYPVAAPSSYDEVWNGIALCSNHHNAFDGHRIWADPATREIRIHPKLNELASVSEASRTFLASTLRQLQPPTSPALAPRPEMFERRYAFYEGRYAWADRS
jgi:predicted restriction endonuclease